MMGGAGIRFALVSDGDVKTDERHAFVPAGTVLDTFAKPRGAATFTSETEQEEEFRETWDDTSVGGVASTPRRKRSVELCGRSRKTPVCGAWGVQTSAEGPAI